MLLAPGSALNPIVIVPSNTLDPILLPVYKVGFQPSVCMNDRHIASQETALLFKAKYSEMKWRSNPPALWAWPG